MPNLATLQVTAECLPDGSFDVSQFPKLHTLGIYTRDVDKPLTADHLTRITRFRQIEKLMFLSLSNIDLPALSELSKLDHLTSIFFDWIPLTDEGLACLVDFPSLKRLTLLHTQITPTGLAKFRAVRPEIMVESDLEK